MLRTDEVSGASVLRRCRPCAARECGCSARRYVWSQLRARGACRSARGSSAEAASRLTLIVGLPPRPSHAVRRRWPFGSQLASNDSPECPRSHARAAVPAAIWQAAIPGRSSRVRALDVLI